MLVKDVCRSCTPDGVIFIAHPQVSPRRCGHPIAAPKHAQTYLKGLRLTPFWLFERQLQLQLQQCGLVWGIVTGECYDVTRDPGLAPCYNKEHSL